MPVDESSAIFHLPRIHTAIAQWLFCVIYLIPVRKKRFALLPGVCLSLAFFGLLILLNRMGEFANGIRWVADFALCMAAMLAMFMAIGVLKLREAVYHWSQAFVMAEFAASLEWQANYYLLHYLELNDYRQAIAVSYTVLIVVYGLTAVTAYWMTSRRRAEHSRYHITGKDAASALLISLSVFGIGNIPFALRGSAFTTSLQLGVLWIRTMADFAGIIILEANESRRRETNLSYELEATENLMQRQYEQYRQFRANDESLHRVYHDLKHQIAFLRTETNDMRKEERLQTMEEVIQRHEAVSDSGNGVLDTLLIGKNLTCMEKKITMTCYADGRQLGFMDAMDICSLFGNAIDNAVECVEQIEDEHKRLIHVTVSVQNEMMLIVIENCCDKLLTIDRDTISTTKPDKSLHGYGLKSIRRTVEKYNGYIKLKQEDGWFSLTVVIPLEKPR